MSWDTSEGQRPSQLTREFLAMGHRVVFVEADPSRNQESYDNENFRLANILPRHWPFYNMEPVADGRGTTASKTARILRFADQKSNSWLVRLVLSKLPRRSRQMIVSKRKGHLVSLDEDLPIIRDRLSILLDDFCRSRSGRVVVFESPMRCYTECLDIFKARDFAIVYELIDKWELMWQGEKIRRQDDELKLIREAVVVTATSKQLLNELGSLYPWRRDILYAPNAVKREAFDTNQVSAIPHDMPRGGEVNVGYFGSICEWFDFETVEFLADSRPRWNFVIIGEHPLRAEFPFNRWQKFISRGNVYALGRKKHCELINYLAHWNVCIVPFVDSALTRATSPVKVYEYLSAYKPVVTFEFEEMQGFPYVYHAKDKEDFLNKIRDALTNPLDRKSVDDFLAENTWRNRAQSILNFADFVNQDFHRGDHSHTGERAV